MPRESVPYISGCRQRNGVGLFASRLSGMSQLQSTIQKLEQAHQAFLRAAGNIPAELWTAAPRPGAWSGAEVVAHLMGVESTVITGAERILQKQPKHIPLLKRFSLPPTIVEGRTIRIKTPVPVDQKLIAPKEIMLAQLGQVRERTLRLMEKTKNRDLRVYRWKHPILGMLHAYGWFSFLASHQIRHTKQMQEISVCLRKAVAGLQK